MRGQWLDEGLRAYNCLVLDFRLIIFRFAQVSEFSCDLQFNQRTELSVFFFSVGLPFIFDKSRPKYQVSQSKAEK